MLSHNECSSPKYCFLNAHFTEKVIIFTGQYSLDNSPYNHRKSIKACKHNGRDYKPSSTSKVISDFMKHFDFSELHRLE